MMFPLWQMVLGVLCGALVGFLTGVVWGLTEKPRQMARNGWRQRGTPPPCGNLRGKGWLRSAR